MIRYFQATYVKRTKYGDIKNNVCSYSWKQHRKKIRRYDLDPRWKLFIPTQVYKIPKPPYRKRWLSCMNYLKSRFIDG